MLYTLILSIIEQALLFAYNGYTYVYIYTRYAAYMYIRTYLL
jgi:hypothetical protein